MIPNVPPQFSRYVKTVQGQRHAWTSEAYRELSGQEMTKMRLELQRDHNINPLHVGEAIEYLMDRFRDLETRIEYLEEKDGKH